MHVYQRVPTCGYSVVLATYNARSATFADFHVFVPKETIEYSIPHCYSTWSAMLPVFTCSVNSCPCENTHGIYTFCLLYVLCARDYGKLMGGNREAKKL